MLQIFLDGSGKSDDPHCRFLTLAGVAAEERVWSEWSERWRKILGEYGVEYSHMRELFQKGKGPFQGWDHERKRKFVLTLLQSLSFKDRIKLICTSLTVDLAAYRSLAVRPDVKPSEAVCVDFCMTQLFAHPHFGEARTDVVFDGNENFQRYLNQTWSRKKSNPDSLLSSIRLVPPPEMRKTPPMQAADLLAWAANRYYRAEEDDTTTWRHLMAMSIVALPRYHTVYREAELINHPGFYGWPGGTGMTTTP